MIFQLCYSQHGGSGLGFNYESVMELPFGDVQWFVDRLDTARKTESRMLRVNKPKK